MSLERKGPKGTALFYAEIIGEKNVRGVLGSTNILTLADFKNPTTNIEKNCLWESIQYLGDGTVARNGAGLKIPFFGLEINIDERNLEELILEIELREFDKIPLGRIPEQEYQKKMEEHFKGYLALIVRDLKIMTNLHLSDKDWRAYGPQRLEERVNFFIKNFSIVIGIGDEKKRDEMIKEMREFVQGSPYRNPISQIIGLMRTSYVPNKKGLIERYIQQACYLAGGDVDEATRVSREIKELTDTNFRNLD